MKKKKKTNAIKDLYLDRPTSHGGWPGGHQGGYTDPNKPVHKQIADYLKAMGLVDDSNPRARLSEAKIRALIREALSNYPPGVTGTEDYFYGEDRPSENADIKDIIDELEETLEDYAVELGYIPEDDDEALRKAYDEDPDFYNDLYDEIIMSRKKTRNLF